MITLRVPCVDELIIFGRHIAYMTSHKNNVFLLVFPLLSPLQPRCIITLFYQGVSPCRAQEFLFWFLSCSMVRCFFFFSVHFFVLHVSPSYFHQSEFISSSSNSSVTVDDNDVYVCAANVTWTESIPYRICNNVSTLNDWSEALNYSFNILLFAWRR